MALVREQINSGQDVYVYPLKGSMELQNEFIALGAKILNFRMDLSFFSQIKDLRKKTKLISGAIVHAHLPQAEIVATLATPHNRKIIVTRHFGGNFYPNANIIFSSLWGKFSTIRAHRVIAISPFVKHTLIKNREVFNKNRIVIIEYGFDTLEFCKLINFKTKVNSPENSIVVGTVARLSTEKRLDVLIEAFAIFVKFKPKSLLRIAGVGPLENTLKEQTKKLGIASKVNFLGKQNNVANVMKDFDIFVLSSEFEGFGMVLLEAMALHKRIIASDIATTKHVLGEAGAAIFFETNCATSLSKKLHESLKIDLVQMTAAQKARLDKFSIQQKKNILDEVYHSVV